MDISQILASKGSDVVTVRPDTPASTAAQLMRTNRVGALVVTGDDAKVDGLLGERELVRAVAANNGSVTHLRVADIMVTACDTCSPGSTVKEVMAQMTRSRSRHVPVVSDGRLCGIVSIGDMVKNRLDEIELESQVLRDAYLTKH